MTVPETEPPAQAAPAALPAPAPPAAPPEAEPRPAFEDSPLGQAFDTGFRVLVGVFVTLLAIVLALVEAFYAPLRTLGVAVPLISLVLAVVGNASLVWFARFATGSRLGVVAPCVAWLGTMLALSSRTTEGDLILPADWRGIGLFFLGASTLTVAGFLVVMPTVNPQRAVAGKP